MDKKELVLKTDGEFEFYFPSPLNEINNKPFYIKVTGNNREALNAELKGYDIGLISDGYHTFDELYEFRKMYNAVLFNEWAKIDNTIRSKNRRKGFSGQSYANFKNVHKSWKHYDGEPCFGGGWFIASAMLPTGLISNHYKAEDWDLFQVPEVEKALYEFDGHTGEDVLKRLKDLTINK